MCNYLWSADGVSQFLCQLRHLKLSSISDFHTNFGRLQQAACQSNKLHQKIIQSALLVFKRGGIGIGKSIGIGFLSCIGIGYWYC